jgi:hypothetical protein
MASFSGKITRKPRIFIFSPFTYLLVFILLFNQEFTPAPADYEPKNVLITGGAGFMYVIVRDQLKSPDR